METKMIGPPVQLAYLVDDLERAAEGFVARGAGPFFWRHHAPMDAVDAAGRSAPFVHSSAYGQWGAFQLELVTVDAGTPEWLGDALRTVGRLHHVAHFVQSFALAQEALTQLGWPAVMTATTSSGAQFAFHDARSELGHLVEIYERSPGIAGLYDRVAAAHASFDGTEPLRPM